ncbi:hypothetical protein [Lentzea sp. NPDC051838]|uniref:hypothetical protein n=1 Tax=Lentzea sp. NPDC051838 TaxID=3154849 RepID=UPI0034479A7B
MQPEQSPAVERAAAWYREVHFWPVLVTRDGVCLPLGRGVVAFDVPADRATRVQEVLEGNDIVTAALLVEEGEPRVQFLAEADDAVFGQFQMPPDVRYLSVPVVLRLPLVNVVSDRSWFRAPDAGRRWFPRAAAVLQAIVAATPRALRGRGEVRLPKRERVLIG